MKCTQLVLLIRSRSTSGQIQIDWLDFLIEGLCVDFGNLILIDSMSTQLRVECRPGPCRCRMQPCGFDYPYDGGVEKYMLRA